MPTLAIVIAVSRPRCTAAAGDPPTPTPTYPRPHPAQHQSAASRGKSRRLQQIGWQLRLGRGGNAAWVSSNSSTLQTSPLAKKPVLTRFEPLQRLQVYPAGCCIAARAARSRGLTLPSENRGRKKSDTKQRSTKRSTLNPHALPAAVVRSPARETRPAHVYGQDRSGGAAPQVWKRGRGVAIYVDNPYGA